MLQPILATLASIFFTCLYGGKYLTCHLTKDDMIGYLTLTKGNKGFYNTESYGTSLVIPNG